MRRLGLIVLGLILFGSPAFAKSDLAMRNVLQRLERLEQENQALRSRVTALEGARQTIVAAEQTPTAPARIAAGMPPVAAPVDTPAPATLTAADNWAGPYLGIKGGVRSNSTTWHTISNFAPPFVFAGQGPAPYRTVSPATVSFNDPGGEVGIFAGYNLALDDLWLVGAEGQFGWYHDYFTVGPYYPGQTPGLIFPPDGENELARLTRSWSGDALARIGLALSPDVMVYTSGGLSLSRIKADASCGGAGAEVCVFGMHSESLSRTMVGWTAGGGVEAMIAPDLSARFDYHYSDYGVLDHVFFALPSGDGNLRAGIAQQSSSYTIGLV